MRLNLNGEMWYGIYSNERMMKLYLQNTCKRINCGSLRVAGLSGRCSLRQPRDLLVRRGSIGVAGLKRQVPHAESAGNGRLWKHHRANNDEEPFSVIIKNVNRDTIHNFKKNMQWSVQREISKVHYKIWHIPLKCFQAHI